MNIPQKTPEKCSDGRLIRPRTRIVVLIVFAITACITGGTLLAKLKPPSPLHKYIRLYPVEDPSEIPPLPPGFTIDASESAEGSDEIPPLPPGFVLDSVESDRTDWIDFPVRNVPATTLAAVALIALTTLISAVFWFAMDDRVVRPVGTQFGIAKAAGLRWIAKPANKCRVRKEANLFGLSVGLGLLLLLLLLPFARSALTDTSRRRHRKDIARPLYHARVAVVVLLPYALFMGYRVSRRILRGLSDAPDDNGSGDRP